MAHSRGDVRARRRLGGHLCGCLPWKYESVAKFLVRNARLDLVVDPNDKNQGAYRESIPKKSSTRRSS
jgi:hypothetical protein